MSELKISGKITKKLEEQSGTSVKGDWIKQSFLIETKDQYPKTICIDTFNKSKEALDKVNEGQDVEVSINIESREYKGRYFTNVSAWRIQVLEGAVQSTPDPLAEGDDSLPF